MKAEIFSGSGVNGAEQLRLWHADEPGPLGQTDREELVEDMQLAEILLRAVEREMDRTDVGAQLIIETWQVLPLPAYRIARVKESLVQDGFIELPPGSYHHRLTDEGHAALADLKTYFNPTMTPDAE